MVVLTLAAAELDVVVVAGLDGADCLGTEVSFVLEVCLGAAVEEEASASAACWRSLACAEISAGPTLASFLRSSGVRRRRTRSLTGSLVGVSV